MKFKNKVVIVTGGASGIGEAAVKAFAKEGAKIVVADFDEKGKDLTSALKKKGHEALFIKTDVSKEKESKKMVAETVKHFGKIDILFANAGIANDNEVTGLTLEAWQKTIDVNLTGVFLSNKYVIEQMVKQKNGGAVVNCSSIHSFVGKNQVTAYAASKGGVKLLTQTLAIDYAKHNIRVNAVCPGYINTPLLDIIPARQKKALAALHPLGRLGRSEEVANAVLFLASDEASFITGASLLIDGGYTAQ